MTASAFLVFDAGHFDFASCPAFWKVAHVPQAGVCSLFPLYAKICGKGVFDIQRISSTSLSQTALFCPNLVGAVNNLHRTCLAAGNRTLTFTTYK
jgi:hypothetical protein